MKTREILTIVALLLLAAVHTVVAMDGTLFIVALVLVHVLYGRELYKGWYRFIDISR